MIQIRLKLLGATHNSKESLAGALGALNQASKDDLIAGVEHLWVFLRAQEKSPSTLISLQGDAVHPGSPGQLMMAAALLKELGADGFVSSATIGFDGKVADAKGCKIEGIKIEGGKLEFDGIEELSAFPIPDDARAVMALDPTIVQLSQYTLKVTGGKDGNFALKINGVQVASLSGKALAAGVNLTTLLGKKGASPEAAQGRAILGAVAAKEGIVSQWRARSVQAHAPNAAPDLKMQLEAIAKKVEAADTKIREAAQPQKLHFEVLAAP